MRFSMDLRTLSDGLRRAWGNATEALARIEWRWPSGWSLRRMRRLDLFADDAARAGRRLGGNARRGMDDLRRVGDDVRDSLRRTSLSRRAVEWWRGLHTRDRRRVVVFSLGAVALVAVSVKWTSGVQPKEPYDREPWEMPADTSKAKPRKPLSEAIVYPMGLKPSPMGLAPAPMGREQEPAVRRKAGERE